MGQDDVRRERGQFRRVFAKVVGVAQAPAVIDPQVAADGPTRLLQPLLERPNAGLEFCIARGIRTFEGGAQGEHKLARGFLPVETRSAHWLKQPQFADAVEQFLKRESAGIGRYVDELADHSPYKAMNPAQPVPP